MELCISTAPATLVTLGILSAEAFQCQSCRGKDRDTALRTHGTGSLRFLGTLRPEPSHKVLRVNQTLFVDDKH